MKEMEKEMQREQFDDLLALADKDRVKMVDLFKRTLTNKDIKFFAKIIKNNPDGEWATTITKDTPVPFHFSGGMGVRNYFRSNGCGEKELGINNLDNIYVSIVEEAVSSISEKLTTKKSFFSKIKSFFYR